MAKYEAVISLTVELDSDDPDTLVYGELTDRLLEVASRDNLFKLWMEVIDINRLEVASKDNLFKLWMEVIDINRLKEAK
jgi:hypothetical protein